MHGSHASNEGAPIKVVNTIGRGFIAFFSYRGLYSSLASSWTKKAFHVSQQHMYNYKLLDESLDTNKKSVHVKMHDKWIKRHGWSQLLASACMPKTATNSNLQGHKLTTSQGLNIFQVAGTIHLYYCFLSPMAPGYKQANYSKRYCTRECLIK